MLCLFIRLCTCTCILLSENVENWKKQSTLNLDFWVFFCNYGKNYLFVCINVKVFFYLHIFRANGPWLVLCYLPNPDNFDEARIWFYCFSSLLQLIERFKYCLIKNTSICSICFLRYVNEGGKGTLRWEKFRVLCGCLGSFLASNTSILN